MRDRIEWVKESLDRVIGVTGSAKGVSGDGGSVTVVTPRTADAT